MGCDPTSFPLVGTLYMAAFIHGMIITVMKGVCAFEFFESHRSSYATKLLFTGLVFTLMGDISLGLKDGWSAHGFSLCSHVRWCLRQDMIWKVAIEHRPVPWNL